MIDKKIFYDKFIKLISDESVDECKKYELSIADLVHNYYRQYLSQEDAIKYSKQYVEQFVDKLNDMCRINKDDSKYKQSHEYILKKRFHISIGHRLSKHKKLCKNIHGHNITVEVELSSTILNENDMIIDFSDVKKIMNKLLDAFDHALLLNKFDELITYDRNTDRDIDKIIYDRGTNVDNFKIIYFDGDPTAENLSKYFFDAIHKMISDIDEYKHIKLNSIRIWESNDSDITCKFTN